MNKNIIIAILALALVLTIGIGIGYQANKDDSKPELVATKPISNGAQAQPVQSDTKLNTLIEYQVPTGWTERSCSGDQNSVYFATDSNGSVDCSATPDSQIKLAISTENFTECSQIQDQKEVKKHVCISKYINNLRSLQAETEFLSSSSFGKETTAKTYYIDTGSGMVKATYIYAGSGSDQAGFDSLVNSIRTK